MNLQDHRLVVWLLVFNYHGQFSQMLVLAQKFNRTQHNKICKFSSVDGVPPAYMLKHKHHNRGANVGLGSYNRQLVTT